jgi:hypothetical protein
MQGSRGSFSGGKGMNLPELVSVMGSNKIWTGIHKNKAAKVIVQDRFALM